MLRQIEHGRYDMDPIYGSGKAAEAIVDILAKSDGVALQKRITY